MASSDDSSLLEYIVRMYGFKLEGGGGGEWFKKGFWKLLGLG